MRIVLTERIPDSYTTVEEVITYDSIMEIWDEDSNELVPQLAKYCKRLEEKIDLAMECLKLNDSKLALEELEREA